MADHVLGGGAFENYGDDDSITPPVSDHAPDRRRRKIR
jgi:hypothetical protein